MLPFKAYRRGISVDISIAKKPGLLNGLINIQDLVFSYHRTSLHSSITSLSEIGII